MGLLHHITVETGKSPQHCTIWLHGLGADGEDFVPVAREMHLPFPMRYVFPYAPMQPVTINNGYVMRAWYDIFAADFSARQDEAGLHESRHQIEMLIARERQQGIAADHIFLAGFSQGGAVALHTGVRHAEALGGIMVLSSYLPMDYTLPNELSSAALDTPVFMAHGHDDPVVPYRLGRKSAEKLSGLGFDLEWHDYPMQHSLCIEEVRDIERWLTRRMARSINHSGCAGSHPAT